MSGFYLMHRGWQDHPVFGNEPYSKRDAFEWLIAHASHKPRDIGIPGKTIHIERGQLCYSLRYLARAWKWDDAKVRRFLSRLERERMIVTKTDAGQTQITVCNYEIYQALEKQPDAASTQERRSDDAASTQIRMNEINEINSDDDGGDARARDPAEVIAADFLARRSRHWPNTSRLPSPEMTIRSDAQQLVDREAPPELIAEVLDRCMSRAAAGGRGPPNGLRAYWDSLVDAIASHKNSLAQGIANDLTIHDRHASRIQPERLTGAAAALAGIARSSGRG